MVSGVRGAVRMFAAVGVVLLAAACAADEIELTNGRKYKGLLIKRDRRFITFKAVIGSGTAEMMFPVRTVKSLKVDGKMPALAPTPQPSPSPAPADTPKPVVPEPAEEPAAGPTPAAKPTVSQINERIAKAGTTRPQWWDSVELKYPPTLDLTGTNRVKGWHPNRNLGAYYRSVLCPNPGRWRQGIKVIDHCVKARKNNPLTLPEARRLLAQAYLRFEKDWARAAYWYRAMLAGNPRGRQSINVAGILAECYWQMGNKPMAVGLLKRYQLQRAGGPDVIRLWGQMGETSRALAVAEWLARRGLGARAYLAAGHVTRKAGKLTDARDYYQKAVDAGRAKKRPPQKFIRTAQVAVEALRLFEKVDLSRISDGRYAGTCPAGYRGPIEVEVVVKDGRIESARVRKHREDLAYTSITDVPASIVASQGLAGVDTITGATVTSEAIINAAAQALASAAN